MKNVSAQVTAALAAGMPVEINISAALKNGGVMEFTAADIQDGGFSINQSSVSGNDIEIGSVIASMFNLDLYNPLGFGGIDLEDAVLTVTGIVYDENNTMHTFPIGVFICDEADGARKKYSLSGFDKMILFDKDYGSGDINYPITVKAFIAAICAECGVTCVTDLDTIPNATYVIANEPEADNLTYRTLLAWAAQITGRCANINAEGKLDLVFYSQQSEPLTTSNVYGNELAQNAISFTGIKVNKNGETIYSEGEDGYVSIITDNGLIQNDFTDALGNIWDVLSAVSYYPSKFAVTNMPLIEPFDIVSFTDEDGNSYPVAVTDVVWAPGKRTEIEAKGTTEKQSSYAAANPMTVQQTEVLNKMKADAVQREQDIVDLSGLVNNSTGLHQITQVQADGSVKYYLANAASLDSATYIATMNAGGFAFTYDWNEGSPVWQYGVSRDGNAILNILQVYKLSADVISAGSLVSNNGNTSFDLDNNEFITEGTIERVTGATTKSVYKTELSYKDGNLSVSVSKDDTPVTTSSFGLTGLRIKVDEDATLSAQKPENWDNWNTFTKTLWWVGIESVGAIAEQLGLINGAINITNQDETKLSGLSADILRLLHYNETDFDSAIHTHEGTVITNRINRTQKTARYGIDSSIPGKLAVKEKIKMGSENYDSPNAEYVASEKYVDDTYANIQGLIGAYGNDVAGISVDFRTGTVERLAGTAAKSPGADFSALFNCYGGRRRCNVADDGTINAYYGDASYTDDGTNGQVMVYQPKFYYKVVPIFYDKTEVEGNNLRKVNYFISDTEKPGFKLHPAFYGEHGNPVDYILLSAYEGVMYDASAGDYVNDGTDTSTETDLDNDLMCSVAGKKPISGIHKNITRVNFEKMAANRGSGWHGDTFKAESANQMLLVVEYASFNMQTAIGRGVVDDISGVSQNRTVLTGSTAQLGNGSGCAAHSIAEANGVQTDVTADGKVSVSYRGMENPWGNIWKHISGLNVYGNGGQNGGYAFIADDWNFVESRHSDNYKSIGFMLPQNGSTEYIRAFGFVSGEYDWAFIPSELGGDTDIPVGDVCLTTADLNGSRTAAYGGNWGRGDTSGTFILLLSSKTNFRSYSTGGRLVYVPSDI